VGTKLPDRQQPENAAAFAKGMRRFAMRNPFAAAFAKGMRRFAMLTVF
jgi:hypothetical protein